MSRNRVEKLNSLLQRVQQRRAEPRLVAVSGGNPISSANTNLQQREAPRALEVAPRPAANLLEALGSELTLDSTPPPVPAAAAVATPVERRPAPPAPAAPDTQPPAARSEPPAQLKTPTSTVPPPVTAADALQRATTEVLPPTPLRVAPSPPVPFDAAVKVVSSPRIEQPKTFGELLEQSLALRPK
jgi:hypothetical protein